MNQLVTAEYPHAHIAHNAYGNEMKALAVDSKKADVDNIFRLVREYNPEFTALEAIDYMRNVYGVRI